MRDDGGSEESVSKKKSMNPDAVDVFLKAFESKSTYSKVQLAQET